MVHVLSLGGTIAMIHRGDAGVVPALTADQLLASVPQVSTYARVEARSFRQVPGAHLTFEDLIDLASEIRRLAAGGSDGFVVTQGTDTIEETAFALDLLVGPAAPVVVTGAMRHPTLPGADGPANLLASVQVAASPLARGLGTLVVLQDEIHAARFVQKGHVSSPGAFASPLTGPIGWVSEGRVRVAVRPGPGLHIEIPQGAPPVRVALVTAALGDDGAWLRALPSLGFDGVVIEGLGAGHVPAGWVEPLQDLARRVPVALASRTGAGESFRSTYGFPGSETDLLERGLIATGILDGPKSRVLLSLLLRSGATREAIAAAFDALIPSGTEPDNGG
ncbi:MAG TPA: asparaginase [Bacillota bacterium]